MEQPAPPILPATDPVSDEKKFVQSMRLSRVAVPVLLGLLAVGWLFHRQFDAEAFRDIEWSGRAAAWLLAGLGLLVLRHFAYALRMRALTGGQFSWRKCAELVVLWEFSAALTPTSKGGPFVMLFVLTREKLAAGRTATAVLYTIICDSGFMVIMLPLLLLAFGPPMLYPGMESFGDVRLASGTFFFTYGFMFAYWAVFAFLLFVRPQYARRALGLVAKIPFLKKYEAKLLYLGTEFELAAAEMRRQNWLYHAQVWLGTFGAWTLKFLMINCLIIAIVPSTPIDGSTQAFIYARMVAMFIIMAFSPTPGGAGLAEVAMSKFITDFVPEGIGVVVALLWRGMAYYGYLLLGAIVVPGWVRAKLGRGAANPA
ncbi:MAG: YbhN family protein [Saprospiraceae bacterium]